MSSTGPGLLAAPGGLWGVGARVASSVGGERKTRAIFLSISTFLTTYLSVCLHLYSCTYLYIYLSIVTFPTIYPSAHLYLCPSTYLSIYRCYFSYLCVINQEYFFFPFRLFLLYVLEYSLESTCSCFPITFFLSCFMLLLCSRILLLLICVWTDVAV